MRLRPGPILICLGLVVMFGFFGWSFYSMRGSSLTGGSHAIAVMIVVGAVGTGALAGVLMWLAFYSSRKGYDEPPKLSERDENR